MQRTTHTVKKKKGRRDEQKKIHIVQQKRQHIKSERVSKNFTNSIAPIQTHSLDENHMPHKRDEEKTNDRELLETPKVLKTVAEIKQLLKTTLQGFPTEGITQISLYAEFAQGTCWLCNKTLWEQFDKEYGIFTIYRTFGWPPQVQNCRKCYERWYTPRS